MGALIVFVAAPAIALPQGIHYLNELEPDRFAPDQLRAYGQFSDLSADGNTAYGLGTGPNQPNALGWNPERGIHSLIDESINDREGFIYYDRSRSGEVLLGENTIGRDPRVSVLRNESEILATLLDAQGEIPRFEPFEHLSPNGQFATGTRLFVTRPASDTLIGPARWSQAAGYETLESAPDSHGAVPIGITDTGVVYGNEVDFFSTIGLVPMQAARWLEDGQREDLSGITPNGEAWRLNTLVDIDHNGDLWLGTGTIERDTGTEIEEVGIQAVFDETGPTRILWEEPIGPGTPFSFDQLLAISGDGSTVIGHEEFFGQDYPAPGPFGYPVPIVWTAEGGRQPLSGLLQSVGIDPLELYRSVRILAVSEDGKSFLLQTWDRDQFRGSLFAIAVIPEPSSALLIALGLSLLSARRSTSLRTSQSRAFRVLD